MYISIVCMAIGEHPLAVDPVLTAGGDVGVSLCWCLRLAKSSIDARATSILASAANDVNVKEETSRRVSPCIQLFTSPETLPTALIMASPEGEKQEDAPEQNKPEQVCLEGCRSFIFDLASPRAFHNGICPHCTYSPQLCHHQPKIRLRFTCSAMYTGTSCFPSY